MWSMIECCDFVMMMKVIVYLCVAELGVGGRVFADLCSCCFCDCT